MCLAQAQGLLNQKSLNYIQYWALGYSLYLERRTRGDEARFDLEQMTYNLAPDRWQAIYQPATLGWDQSIPPEEQEEEVMSIDELDHFWENLEKEQVMTAAQAFKFADTWGDWQ